MKYGEKIQKALEVLRINPNYTENSMKEVQGIGRITYYDAKRILTQEKESEQNEPKSEQNDIINILSKQPQNQPR